MEKISIKKELYFEKYEFLKFYVLFRILFDFFNEFSYLKSSKREFTNLWADVASGETVDATRGKRAIARRRLSPKATWQAASGPCGAQEAHGAATWRRATRQREHTWVPVWAPRVR